MDQSTPSTLDIVIAIVSDLSGNPEPSIIPESNLVTELGLGSLELVQMAMTIESTFDLPPIDYDPARMQTVADVVKFVEVEKLLMEKTKTNAIVPATATNAQ